MQEDYKVVEAESAKALSTAVHNEMVSYERWQPVGGVAVNGGMFYQAMLRGRRGGTARRGTRRTH
jgi:hypothetical protein